MATSLEYQIRHGLCPDNPGLLTRWLSLGCCRRDGLSTYAVCSVCPRRHQFMHYESQFRLLMEVVVDEILPPHWRCLCLDQIYKPLFAMRRLATDPNSEAYVRALQQELSITTRYVQASLSSQPDKLF